MKFFLDTADLNEIREGAALVGAAYISPFLGRLDDIGHSGLRLLAGIVEIYRNYDWKTEVLAASFYLRTTGGLRMLGGSYTVPLLLSVLGVILILISGYLGGELVFRYGVAVNPQYDTAGEAKGKARVS